MRAVRGDKGPFAPIVFSPFSQVAERAQRPHLLGAGNAQ